MSAAAGLPALWSTFRAPWRSGKTATNLCDAQRPGKPDGGASLTSPQQPKDITVEENLQHPILLKEIQPLYNLYFYTSEILY